MPAAAAATPALAEAEAEAVATAVAVMAVALAIAVAVDVLAAAAAAAEPEASDHRHCTHKEIKLSKQAMLAKVGWLPQAQTDLVRDPSAAVVGWRVGLQAAVQHAGMCCRNG